MVSSSVFFHWWTPWVYHCCERFIGAHRLQPVGFGSHFRWLGRVFQPMFMWFFKNPKANHRETGCMKTYLKTLSEIMGSLSTNLNWCIFKFTIITGERRIYGCHQQNGVRFVLLVAKILLQLNRPAGPNGKSQKAVVVCLLIFYGGRCAVVFFPFRKKKR